MPSCTGTSSAHGKVEEPLSVEVTATQMKYLGSCKSPAFCREVGQGSLFGRESDLFRWQRCRCRYLVLSRGEEATILRYANLQAPTSAFEQVGICLGLASVDTAYEPVTGYLES